MTHGLLTLVLFASPPALEVPPDQRAMRPLEVVAPAGLTLSAQSCLDCHAGPHEQWASSRHASASTNALFTASFARQDRTWCVNCHAPLAQQRIGNPPRLTELGREGVNCAACHLREGQVLSSHAPTPSGQSAHPMTHAPALATAEFCASCHDFNVPWVNLQVPVQRPGYSEVPMQDTYDEWKTSSAARRGVGCVDCHMPRGSHAVTGARDVAWLSRALRVEARASKQGVEVTLRATGVAHSFPTGDPFRMLRFEACEDSACLKPVAVRRLHRSIIEGQPSMVIPPATASDEAELRFRLETPARPSQWRLIYSLAEPGLEKKVPVAERELVLLSGAVAKP